MRFEDVVNLCFRYSLFWSLVDEIAGGLLFLIFYFWQSIYKLFLVMAFGWSLFYLYFDSAVCWWFIEVW